MCGKTVMRRIRCVLLAAAVGVFALLSVFLTACSGRGESPDLLPHLITTPDTDPIRPIDGFDTYEMSPFDGTLTGTVYRMRVKELYSAVVDRGSRPVFAANDPVKPVYDAAIAVLDRYVLNAWHGTADGAVRIVHTVHDYLISHVDYDFELYDAYNRGEVVGSDDPAFDIDGVFLNRRAVCDGLSRAVAFLCAVEDVECMRVTGSFAGTPHAWNKVKIDGKWYNIDVTADAANYTVEGSGGGKYKKQISHGYMLLSDDTYLRFGPNGASSAHVFERTVECNADHDYYKDLTVRIGGESYAVTVTSQSELNAIFSAISDEKGGVGKIELKLAFDGKVNVNDGDVYEAEIRSAYNKLKNPDFMFTDTQKPYFRYPNGVYIFLMYR